MAIQNNICEKCKKVVVCERIKVISKFHEDAKRPMGVDIQILSCDEYEHVE